MTLQELTEKYPQYWYRIGKSGFNWSITVLNLSNNSEIYSYICRDLNETVVEIDKYLGIINES